MPNATLNVGQFRLHVGGADTKRLMMLVGPEPTFADMRLGLLRIHRDDLLAAAEHSLTPERTVQLGEALARVRRLIEQAQ